MSGSDYIRTRNAAFLLKDTTEKATKAPRPLSPCLVLQFSLGEQEAVAETVEVQQQRMLVVLLLLLFFRSLLLDHNLH